MVRESIIPHYHMSSWISFMGTKTDTKDNANIARNPIALIRPKKSSTCSTGSLYP